MGNIMTRHPSKTDSAESGKSSNIGKYIVVEELERGGHGRIKKVRLKTDDERVFALKEHHENKKKYLQNEIEVLKKCKVGNHNNIVEFIQDGTYAGKSFFVMEYVDGGDLVDHLNNCKMNMSQKVQFLIQCASGLKFIHEKVSVAHRDIKPGNVLVKRMDNNNVSPKIADFGLAKFIREGTEMMDEFCGTPEFLAPEVFAVKYEQRDGYTKEVDVFSLGLISLCVLRNEVNPYSSSENTRERFFNFESNAQTYVCVPYGHQLYLKENVALLEQENIEEPEMKLRNLIKDMAIQVECRSNLHTVLHELKDIEAKMKQKPMEKNPEPLPFIIVAAMVIGPTTSYAFSFITSQEDIKMPKMEYAGNYMYRVPTSVLTDENDTFLEFGGAAEERYVEDVKSGATRHLYKFDKEILTEGVNYEKVTSVDGHTSDAFRIYRMVLEYLRQRMLNAIEQYITNRLVEHDIKWVIVIPSTWGIKGTKYLTNVLSTDDKKRGIIFKNKLVVTDNEAASFYCIKSIESAPSADGDRDTSKSEQFILVNAWGDYVDVGIYSKKHTEAGPEIVGVYKHHFDAGEDDITKGFVQLLQNIFSNEFTTHMEIEQPDSWKTLLEIFHRASRRMASHNSPKQINVPLPYAMPKLCEKYCKGKSVEEAISKASHLGVRFSNGMLFISAETVKNIHKPVVDLVDELDKVIIQNEYGFNHLKALFLVGSFAENKYLQEMIRLKFSGKILVTIPDDGHLVELKGAVQMGHQKKVYLS